MSTLRSSSGSLKGPSGEKPRTRAKRNTAQNCGPPWVRSPRVWATITFRKAPLGQGVALSEEPKNHKAAAEAATPQEEETRGGDG